MRISVLSASVRTGRQSHKVALFFKKFLKENGLAEVDMIDLKEFNFPVFEERLSKTPDPSPKMVEFSDRIKNSDGIIIVTPEYNGGYPASLKNAIDLLYPEWKHMPIGIAAVSDGQYGGSQVLTSLTFTLTKIGANVIGNMYRVANVSDAYDDEGNATDPKTQKFAKGFVDELLWHAEAKRRMENKG